MFCPSGLYSSVKLWNILFKPCNLYIRVSKAVVKVKLFHRAKKASYELIEVNISIFIIKLIVSVIQGIKKQQGNLNLALILGCQPSLMRHKNPILSRALFRSINGDFRFFYFQNWTLFLFLINILTSHPIFIVYRVILE